MKRTTVFYATRSPYKQQELDIISAEVEFTSADGKFKRKIGEFIDFRVSDVPTDEPLEIDLEKMVRHKARSAYRAILAPCIVEHAGLIFEPFHSKGYPGGLTQPMWDALGGEHFISRNGIAGERAIARAVVGFCDGMSIRTFIGETQGYVADKPRGTREFYWDPIFCPDDGAGLTYSEITDGSDGLRAKLLISQSTKALARFATYLSGLNGSTLFNMDC